MRDHPFALLSRRALLGTAAALCLPAARAAEDAPPQPWRAGRPVPPLDLPGHGGPGFRLSEARGQAVLLNFWASWCEPCRTEMPSLELMAERHARDGLRVWTVNHKETAAAIDRFLALMPIGLPILRDADGAASRAWGVRMFPTTVFIGRDGQPLCTWTGEVDWQAPAARQQVQQLLRTGRL